MKLPLPAFLVTAGLSAALTTHFSCRADVVTDWNATAEAAIIASSTPAPPPPLQARSLAIVNAAIFDAVNGIARKYRPYRVTDPAPPGARQEAAAAAAAYTVLKGLYPGLSDMLEEKYSESIARIPGIEGNSQSIARGVVWGEKVAQAILAWRATDGLTPPPPAYMGDFAAGQWRSIPNGTVGGLLPQFGSLVPFIMRSPSQFRPGPPPALDSLQYANDVNEVKAIGRVDSATRTMHQSDMARLWAAVTAVSENTIIRSLVPKGNSLVDNARMFALSNFAGCDALIAAYDAKYVYGYWRPYHAIRLANTDGRADTIPDSLWTPFINTPNHPEYISAHSVETTANFGVVAILLGNNTPVTVSSPVLPGIVRHYSTIGEACVEVGLARIWGGIHFRTACDVGHAIGLQIAAYAAANYLQPR